METAILLLLLALSDKNSDMKESLNRFLCFYKENRELIRMLAGTLSQRDKETVSADTESEKQQENRPPEEVGNLNILEEYLRRANA